MQDIEILYASGDRFLVDVRGHDFVIDQPRDAGGDDVGPTPTEVFVASVGACVGFYAERFMRRHDVDPVGLRIRCGFRMSEEGPPRVSAIDIHVVVPDGFPTRRRAALEAVARRCTVHNSLVERPDVRIAVDDRVLAPA